MRQVIRVTSTAAAFVLCGIALTACMWGPGPPSGGPAPAAFTDREPLSSCGEVVLGQGEEVPQEAKDCLQDASTDGAELAVTRPTVEGDPVTEYYRVLPGELGWVVFIDMTQDAYGGGWWRNNCPDAISFDDLGECLSAEL